MKYLRRSRKANIIYFIGGSVWASSKSKNLARRLSFKLNQLIQRRNSSTTKDQQNNEAILGDQIVNKQYSKLDTY